MNYIPAVQSNYLTPKRGKQPSPLSESEKQEIARLAMPVDTTLYKGTAGYELEGKGAAVALEDTLFDKYGAVWAEFDKLASMPTLPVPEPLITGGWVRYAPGKPPEKVAAPLETVLLWDTETYVKGGGHPIIATALSRQAWYVWLDSDLALYATQGYGGHYSPKLVPVGFSTVLIAHNALFDAARTEEAYQPEHNLRPYSFCTMAANAITRGQGGDQVYRAVLAQSSRSSTLNSLVGDSLSDLAEAYTGQSVSKEDRKIFVNGTFEEICSQLPKLLDYAINDTAVLHQCFVGLWPVYRHYCPSLVTFGGLLELSRTRLTLAPDYWLQVANNDRLIAAKQAEWGDKLRELARDAAQTDPLEALSDPWLMQLDWTPAKTGKNKGLPAWYRKPKGKNPTLSTDLAPVLCRLSWDGHPLVKVTGQGWGFYVDGKFEKLPHEDGPKANVGSPFAKQFAKYFDSGVLRGETGGNLAAEISRYNYWGAFSGRFNSIYTPKKENGCLLSVPQTIIAKTLTGRQVHRLWLTAAQTKPGKLGTDMSHSIQAPKGWVFVSADEDTEEVRIAALWADYYRGKGLGCTPMSQYAFRGKKEDGTDAHTLTAKLSDITRQEAKTANFRDIFGGGRVTQENALRALHPEWSQDVISSKVASILSAKRGVKHYRDGEGLYSGGTDSDYHNQATEIANTPHFRLPMTGRLIPQAIEASGDKVGSFFTSRYNYPVQGTGTDLLHAIAVSVPLVAEQYGIPDSDWGYVLARHDEYCYLVRKGQAKLFAQVLQEAHRLAWALLLNSMGFDLFPLGAWELSAVNVDTVYRKEPDHPTSAMPGTGWPTIPQGNLIAGDTNYLEKIS